MKKIILPLFLAFSLVCNVSVALDSAQTENRIGPDLTPEKVFKGSAKALTSESTPATGSNTFFYMFDKTNIGVGLIPWNNRTLTVRLYEDDFWNSNDLVKVYTWNFDGRFPKDVSIDLRISGAIEGSNDSTAELFVEMDITKNSADKAGATTGNFFKYYYGIN